MKKEKVLFFIILALYWVIALSVVMKLSAQYKLDETNRQLNISTAKPVMVPYLNFDIKDLEKRHESMVSNR